MLTRRNLIAAGLAGTSLGAFAQFRVEISGVGATQVPIAIPRFRDEDKAAQQISAIVRADLERSGFFRPVEVNGAALDETARPAMSEWRARSVDALAAGSVQRLADGRVDVRFKLWDVVKGSELGGQASAVDPADLRLAAHRIADYIYEKLTGDKGVFSTRIAYVTRGGGRYTLRVADSDGEGGQVALNSPEPIISPAWSPDGRELAYVSFESQKAVIYAQDVMTGKRRPIANFRGSNSAPAWSPDGGTIAATLSREGGSQLFLMNADGTGVRRVMTSPGADTEAWFMPDGRSLLFTSDRGGSPQVYRVGVDGGGVERITFDGSYNVSPRALPDGKGMVYVRRDGNRYQIAIMDFATRQTQVLTSGPLDESPSVAPNGKLILYANETAGRGILNAVSADGRVKQRIVAPAADVREPAWGPLPK